MKLQLTFFHLAVSVELLLAELQHLLAALLLLRHLRETINQLMYRQNLK